MDIMEYGSGECIQEVMQNGHPLHHIHNLRNSLVVEDALHLTVTTTTTMHRAPCCI